MIRKATPDDCLNLAALSLQVWLDTYATEGLRNNISSYVISTFTEGYFLQQISRPAYNIWVFVEGEHLLGFIAVDLESEYEDKQSGYEIETLYVSRHFQGRGIGSQLLKQIESIYGSPFWLSVWVNNNLAISFYKKQKFKLVGEINFELDGELHKNHVLSYFGT